MCVLHVGLRDFPHSTLEMSSWTNNRTTSHHAPRQILKPRRLTLLASVAALSMAVLVVGPGGYRPFNLPAWTASAHAAETTQNPAGFADLVAKVKPAVISVRVKIDGDGDNMPVSQRDEGCQFRINPVRRSTSFRSNSASAFRTACRIATR